MIVVLMLRLLTEFLYSHNNFIIYGVISFYVGDGRREVAGGRLYYFPFIECISISLIYLLLQ